MRILEFEVPGNPVGKGRPRFVRSTGRTFTPEKTARYENLVALSFRQAYPDWEPTEEQVEVIMNAYFEIPKSWSKKKQEQARSGRLRPMKKPDTDNIAKMKDALNALAWHDDAQVVEETIKKFYSDEPHLYVMITVGTNEEEEE